MGAKFETQNADHERDPGRDGKKGRGSESETATLLVLIL